MDNNVINVNRLSKSYGSRKVLKELSLKVPAGSVFGLLGKNGAGKTTLIKCAMGLLKPSAGEIQVLGDDPWRFKDATKARIGFVPQTDRIFPWLTVQQLLNHTGSFYPRWDKGLVNRLLKDWELDPSQKVGLLSEGQAQTLMIILALAPCPELLVFDEPVASLDPVARRQFLKTILDLVADRECTVFFSTHITSDLERVADRVAVLKEGRIDFCGGLDELKDGVKRLRVVSPDRDFQHLTYPGVVNCTLRGREALLTVREYLSDIKAALVKDWQASVTVEDLSLEEIFVELHK